MTHRFKVATRPYVPICTRSAVVPTVIRARHYVLLPRTQIGSSVRARWRSSEPGRAPRAPGILRVELDLDGEQFPGARDALEFVLAAVGEEDARSGQEVRDRARNQHLAGHGERGDAGSDMHGDAADTS
jgi:hypothetical protein